MYKHHLVRNKSVTAEACLVDSRNINTIEKEGCMRASLQVVLCLHLEVPFQAADVWLSSPSVKNMTKQGKHILVTKKKKASDYKAQDS